MKRKNLAKFYLAEAVLLLISIYLSFIDLYRDVINIEAGTIGYFITNQGVSLFVVIMAALVYKKINRNLKYFSNRESLNKDFVSYIKENHKKRVIIIIFITTILILYRNLNSGPDFIEVLRLFSYAIFYYLGYVFIKRWQFSESISLNDLTP